jgi:hypothetical protein
MLSTLAVWTFGCMVFLMPPRQNDVARLKEFVILSIIIADASEATPLPNRTSRETAAQLIQIAYLESGFSIHAVGKLGEQGPFQLLNHVPTTLRGQAKEAIRRWRVQGPAGYTGEAGQREHPLADHRRFGAALLAAAFTP